MPGKMFWSVTQGAVGDWWNDNCMRLSASLAFYTALSLAPLVLLVVGLAGLVIERQRVASQLGLQIEGLVGPAGRQLVEAILTTTTPHGGALATVIGFATLILGATAVFGELQTSLNLIWEVQAAPTKGIWANMWAWLKQRFLSLAIVFAIAFLLLVSLVVSAALANVAAAFQSPDEALLGRVLEIAISLPVLTGLFALLFKYMPDAEIHWRDVWVGGAFSAVLFTLGKTAIGYYIGHASVGSAYGAAGSLVVLLVWVYYSSLIFFFGAEFTHAWATREHAITPKAHAAPGAAPQHKSDAAEPAAAPRA
jgi:membrane protein